MLIEFSVENFMSIRDRVTLSLLAGKETENMKNVILNKRSAAFDLDESNYVECGQDENPSESRGEISSVKDVISTKAAAFRGRRMEKSPRSKMSFRL